MQIVQQLGGYTLGRADLVRRAMSKKKEDVMAKERKNFVYGNEEEHVPGCIAIGIDEKVADHIFDEMTDFAKYAFNKSHAAAYAVVSYQTAWLKCYYKEAYMAAVMASVIDNSEKLSYYMEAAREEGIKVDVADINESEPNFSEKNGVIRFAFAGISGISVSTAKELVKARGEGFKTFDEALKKLAAAGIGKKVVRNLICAGAFDGFGKFRSQLLYVYESFMDAEKKELKKQMEGQLSLLDLFGEMQESSGIMYPEIQEMPERELLEEERSVCGTYITGHPLDMYRTFVKKMNMLQKDVALGEKKCIVCLVQKVNIKYTKKDNKKMAILDAVSANGPIDIVVFNKTFESLSDPIEENACYAVFGKEKEDGDETSFICNEITPIESVPASLYVKFNDMEEYSDKKASFENVMTVNGDGKDCINAILSKERLSKPYPNVSVKEEKKLNSYKELLGGENVALYIPKAFFDDHEIYI